MVIGTDCTGSYKSNYHTIMTTTAPDTNYITGETVNVNNTFTLLKNLCFCRNTDYWKRFVIYTRLFYLHKFASNYLIVLFVQEILNK